MINPAKERKRRADRRGAAGIAITIILVAAGLYVYYGWLPNPRPLGPDLCPSDGKPPTDLIVVLIDSTDPLNAIQRQQVVNELERTIDALPQYAQVRLYAVDSAGDSLLRPVTTVCNPGSGAGKSRWLSNPELMKRRWHDRFFGPLKGELDKLLLASRASTSPILESIQSIAVGALDEPGFDHVAKQLIIVSDMVQNSACLSQYRRLETFDSFRKSNCYVTARPHLDDVDVEILYLRRSDVAKIQGYRHLEFWQEYFFDAGAKVSGVTSIEGNYDGGNPRKLPRREQD